MKAAQVIAAIAAGAVSTSCGDLYADPMQDTPTASPPFDASAAIADNNQQPCDPERPSSNSPCNVVGQTCEYGSSPDSRCNETLVCVQSSAGAGWIARPWTACSRSLCPKGKIANIEGTPCSLGDADGGATDESDELACPMTDGICACTTGPDAAHAHARQWSCVKPAVGCPAQRPLAGQSCQVSGFACDYGSCVFKRGRRMTCNGFLWETGDSSCN